MLSSDKKAGDSIWKGLILVVGIAAGAFALHKVEGFHLISPMMMAVFLGLLFRRAFRIRRSFRKGITFALQRLLKIAVVLLGLQLNFTQIFDVGWNGFLAITFILTSTFFFSLWVGRQLGLDQRLTRLIAIGTSICGASAIIGANSVIKGKEEHVAYSITVVTLFGFLSMLLFPLIGELFQLAPKTFGFWAGTSIHETAQVIGAAFQGGQESGEVGTVAKLSRVLFLAPAIIILGCIPGERSLEGGDAKLSKRSIPVPWFVIGFIGMVTINSFLPLTPELLAQVKYGNKFLLTVTLAALGLQMSFSKIKKVGLRPLCLGGCAWLFVSTVGFISACIVD